MKHQSRFERLDQLLAHHSRWWQLQTFHSRDFPWRDESLKQSLWALSDEQVQALDQDPERLSHWLSEWIPAAQELQELSAFERLASREIDIPERVDYQVPGRKWQQICQFLQSKPKSQNKVLEWCSGKGHLGRVLAAVDGSEVTSLEWQAGLCEAGDALSQRLNHLALKQHFHCVDAFSEQAADYLTAQGELVALHACGDLHTTAMKHWLEKGGQQLAISPCCYHLIRDENYQPLSSHAAGAKLVLSKADLSLPLQETVTAGATERRRRDHELQWRLAFDEWQRDARGCDEYLPLPALRKSQLQGSFLDFIVDQAISKKLPVPEKSSFNETYWLSRGLARMRLVRRLELVTHLFRRPLEAWLILDRALFLEEQGAKVTVGEFCQRQLTPRNIMIIAERDV